jgi:Flp pilus assembly pilin Flp
MIRKFRFAQLLQQGGYLMTMRLGHIRGIRKLIDDDAGSSAIEYAIMASVMGLMLVPIVAYLSKSVQASYDRLLSWF